MLVPIIRQPGCPQRQSRLGISSAFQAQITQANPFLLALADDRGGMQPADWLAVNKEEESGEERQHSWRWGVCSMRAALNQRAVCIY